MDKKVVTESENNEERSGWVLVYYAHPAQLLKTKLAKCIIFMLGQCVQLTPLKINDFIF